MATTTTIPANFMDLFKKPAFGNLATLNPDGSPQVTPVWVDFDGKNVLVNTAKGRVKHRNLEDRIAPALRRLLEDHLSGQRPDPVHVAARHQTPR